MLIIKEHVIIKKINPLFGFNNVRKIIKYVCVLLSATIQNARRVAFNHLWCTTWK